jgi:hypothetical protein
MAKRRLFEAGDMVTTFTGQPGIVISEAVLAAAESRLKEGKRPGHYFAPGCCHHPDYVVQVPVLFEDDTYDVMRAMNIRRAPALTEEKKSRLQGLMNTLTRQQAAADKEGD